MTVEIGQGKSVPVAMVGAGLFLVGTYGHAQQLFSTVWLQPSASLSHKVSITTRKPALSVQEIVSKFKEAGFPVSAIAEIARVERKTIYSWMDGIPARPQNDERMQLAYGSLNSANGGKPAGLYRVWRQKLSDGSSLRDQLTAEDLRPDSIVAAVQELQPSIDYQLKLAQKRSKASSLESGNPVIEQMPIAVLSDK